MAIDLHTAVATFFAIGNGGDLSQLPACFAADAVVRDEREEHRGLAAISQWLTTAQQKYDYRAEPLSASRAGDAIRVTALVSGNFPGSPLQLVHTFVLAGNRILSLEIG